MGGVDVLPAGEEEAYVSSSAKEMVVLVFVCKAGGGYNECLFENHGC